MSDFLLNLFTGKKILGRVEYLTLVYKGRKKRVKARIDTGAFRSSVDIGLLEKLDFPHVVEIRSLLGKKFPNRQAARKMAKQHSDKYFKNQEILKFVTIAAATAGSIEIRPVIVLETWFGDQSQAVEYTVANRQLLTKPLLIGRQDLTDRFLVDSGKQFQLPPL